MTTSIVIVGAGQSGYAASTTLRKGDADSRIVLIGDEDHPPYDRPPLSKAVLIDPAQSAPYFLQREDYAARNIELVTGTPVTDLGIADRTVRLADGTGFPFDQLLIATGGRPRELTMPGHEAIHYLRTYAQAEALRRHLVPGNTLLCIGAGVISLEIAASARRLGAEVYVVEFGDAPMARMLPPPERAFVQAMHKRKGVEFRYRTTVSSIEPNAGAYLVHLSNGEVIHADLVVAGIGMERNTELAVAAGLPVDQGIVVDQFGRTEIDNIFAAGDVASFYHPLLDRHLVLESWHHALEHATAVARSMQGELTPYQPVPRFWSDQYGFNIQAAGDHGPAVSFLLEGGRGDGKFAALYLDPDHRVVFGIAVNDPRRMRTILKSIAAGERIQGDALASLQPLEPAAARPADPTHASQRIFI